jgi:hypothetical protein
MQMIWLTISMLVNQMTADIRQENIRLQSELEQTRLALRISDNNRYELQKQLIAANRRNVQ